MIVFYNKMKLYFLTTFFCVFLTSCIIVEDIGVYWDKGVVDSSLQGSWAKDTACMEFVLDGKDYYVVYNGRKEERKYRTLTLGNNKFLMITNEDNKTNEEDQYILVKYKVFADNFTTYKLDKTKKDVFIQEYPDANVIFSDGDHPVAIISHLDEKSAALLQIIADDETYWKVDFVKHRVKECKVSDAER